jgi:hypothetical protein
MCAYGTFALAFRTRNAARAAATKEAGGRGVITAAIRRRV